MTYNEYMEMLKTQVIAVLAQGINPWQGPWNQAVNGFTDRAYRGINAVNLSLISHHYFGGDNRYFTFAQAKELGCHVKQGSKSIPVFYFQNEYTRDKKDKNGNFVLDENGESVKETVKIPPIFKTFAVFNAQQLAPVPENKSIPKDIDDFDHDLADKYLEQAPCHISYSHPVSAYYSPKEDKIVTFSKEHFANTPQEFYSTAFHEIAHSTGTIHRLARPLEAGNKDLEKYAIEELVAEITALSVCEDCEMKYVNKNSAQYIGSWLKAIKDPNFNLASLYSDVSKATRFIEHPEDRDTLISNLWEKEDALYIKNEEKQMYMHIQKTDEEELDYTLYNSNFKDLDGGRIADTTFKAAIEDISSDLNIFSPWKRVHDFEILKQQEVEKKTITIEVEGKSYTNDFSNGFAYASKHGGPNVGKQYLYFFSPNNDEEVVGFTFTINNNQAKDYYTFKAESMARSLEELGFYSKEFVKISNEQFSNKFRGLEIAPFEKHLSEPFVYLDTDSSTIHTLSSAEKEITNHPETAIKYTIKYDISDTERRELSGTLHSSTLMAAVKAKNPLLADYFEQLISYNKRAEEITSSIDKAELLPEGKEKEDSLDNLFSQYYSLVKQLADIKNNFLNSFISLQKNPPESILPLDTSPKIKFPSLNPFRFFSLEEAIILFSKNDSFEYRNFILSYDYKGKKESLNLELKPGKDFSTLSDAIEKGHVLNVSDQQKDFLSTYLSLHEYLEKKERNASKILETKNNTNSSVIRSEYESYANAVLEWCKESREKLNSGEIFLLNTHPQEDDFKYQMPKNAGGIRKVYISGPITSNPDYEKNFKEAEKALLTAGYEQIINPVELVKNIIPQNTSAAETWRRAMEIDLDALKTCDAMILLDRAGNPSTGMDIEIFTARAINIPIVTLSHALERKNITYNKKEEPTTKQNPIAPIISLSCNKIDNFNYNNLSINEAERILDKTRQSLNHFEKYKVEFQIDYNFKGNHYYYKGYEILKKRTKPMSLLDNVETVSKIQCNKKTPLQERWKKISDNIVPLLREHQKLDTLLEDSKKALLEIFGVTSSNLPIHVLLTTVSLNSEDKKKVEYYSKYIPDKILDIRKSLETGKTFQQPSSLEEYLKTTNEIQPTQIKKHEKKNL